MGEKGWKDFLTATVPVKRYGPGPCGTTRSYLRPLEQYVDAFSEADFKIERVCEIPPFLAPKR